MGKNVRFGIVVTALLMGGSIVWAQMGHEHGHGGHGTAAMTEHNEEGEQTLTGEVVDVYCYLSHGNLGLGEGHAKCAKKCIQGGLPVAIKVGDQLYLASMKDHQPANEMLAEYAGQQVTVSGKVMERDGQRFISVSEVQAVN